MFYQVIQYIKFLFKSTNQHGIHSPFVFDLVTKCFYDKAHYSAYNAISSYKKSLLKINTKINVLDLGKGSRLIKRKERKVYAIAKNAGTTYKRAKLLYRLSKYFKSKSILELGTSLGIATHALSSGHPEAKVTTIEGCPNTAKFAKEGLQAHQANNITVITGDFNDHIKKLDSNSFDLVFFDGNHQKEATLNYFEVLLPTAHNNSVFIFDDIYWSKGMTEAWEIIKQHPKVTVTIDTFYWGLVFFRREQVKEHFTIRI
ncbi:class I SAM-dependent methyltransferase [Tamlana sp. 2201CG12-4]|uniref:O-methyltransferase n=1 Tax=Tamlana sp. 2201CG12-4 TaxID=3112582 RepID=UPI002DBC578B|nr:class I SAM-dependent methyltransferase [Tamlana sp. 2201CG12-4]MEC3907326.1 class I SAM-dependent methyltransferase [Tamlana sp. 2201CG12-4]